MKDFLADSNAARIPTDKVEVTTETNCTVSVPDYERVCDCFSRRRCRVEVFALGESLKVARFVG